MSDSILRIEEGSEIPIDPHLLTVNGSSPVISCKSVLSRDSRVRRTLKIYDPTNGSLTVREKVRECIASALASNVIKRAPTVTEGCHKTRLLRVRVSFHYWSEILDNLIRRSSKRTAQGGTSSRLATTVVVGYAAAMTDG